MVGFIDSHKKILDAFDESKYINWTMSDDANTLLTLPIINQGVAIGRLCFGAVEFTMGIGCVLVSPLIARVRGLETSHVFEQGCNLIGNGFGEVFKFPFISATNVVLTPFIGLICVAQKLRGNDLEQLNGQRIDVIRYGVENKAEFKEILNELGFNVTINDGNRLNLQRVAPYIPDVDFPDEPPVQDTNTPVAQACVINQEIPVVPVDEVREYHEEEGREYDGPRVAIATARALHSGVRGLNDHSSNNGSSI